MSTAVAPPRFPFDLNKELVTVILNELSVEKALDELKNKQLSTDIRELNTKLSNPLFPVPDLNVQFDTKESYDPWIYKL